MLLDRAGSRAQSTGTVQPSGTSPFPGHCGASLEPRSSALPWGVQRAVVLWDCSLSVGGKTYQEFRSAWSSVSCTIY